MKQDNEYTQQWLEIRERLINILLQYGIIEKRNDSSGFWHHDISGNATWFSMYDLLEQPND